MSKNKSLDKGRKREREIVKEIKRTGIEAKRVPLSGSTEFAKGDVHMCIDGKFYIGEVKYQSTGFKQIYKYLEGRDILFCKGSRKGWIVVMREDMFFNLLEIISRISSMSGKIKEVLEDGSIQEEREKRDEQ